MSFMRPEIKESEKGSGYCWRLSAPGYLDCTDWTRSKSLLGAIVDCADQEGESFDLSDWKELLSYDCDLESFCQAYLLAVGFTATSSEGEPLFPCQGEFSDSYDWQEIAETIDQQELNSFIGSAVDFYFRAKSQKLIEPKEDLDRLGANFHFSRNGHGTGFWDSDHKHKQKLQELAKTYGEQELRGAE
jgi:hypothetical protein